MDTLQDIYNFRQVSDTLATSGRPQEAAFQFGAEPGYRAVRNLALHDDPRCSSPHEPSAVRAAGTEYVHVPLPFGSSSRADPET